MDLDKRLYLDYNATSPLSSSVINWLKSGDVLFANPSSQHSSGKAARKVINEARSALYSCFHQDEKNTKLFFHSGATEGITTIAHSFSEWARLTGKDLLICYSKIDHPAVTSLSEHYFGPHVKFFDLKIDQNLEYENNENFAALKDKKDNNPDLIILYHHLWVHNETGIVSPLESLKKMRTISDLYIHVDAVQAPGKIENWQALTEGDLWSFSAHKFGALKGIGFTFFRKTISFHPLITGGGQQNGLRSGTENPQGVMSISLALKDLVKVDVSKNSKTRSLLESFIESQLKDLGALVSNKSRHRNSNTIYFYLNNLSSDIALALFDQHGLEISAGSACSSGAAKPSAILTHLGFKDQAKNGLRLSFDFEFQKLDLLQKKLITVFGKIRSV